MQQVAPFKYGRRRPKGKKGCLPMLTKRQNHIIDILNSERRPVTGKELGSFRSVGPDHSYGCGRINSEYGCRLILANRRSGYHVTMS